MSIFNNKQEIIKAIQGIAYCRLLSLLFWSWSWCSLWWLVGCGVKQDSNSPACLFSKSRCIRSLMYVGMDWSRFGRVDLIFRIVHTYFQKVGEGWSVERPFCRTKSMTSSRRSRRNKNKKRQQTLTTVCDVISSTPQKAPQEPPQF